MYISIQFNNNFIYIIIFIIINVIQDLFNSKTIQYSDYFNEFFDDFILIFLIMFYLLEKYRTKNESVVKEEKKTKFTIFGKIKELSLKKIGLFFSSLISFSIYDYNQYKYKTKNNIDIFVIFILFFILLKLFIFKEQVYSHQILSMCIIIITLFCSTLYNNKELHFQIYNILLILSYYSLSFSLLLMKYINTVYFINIYLIATICGVFRAILFFSIKYKRIKGLYKFVLNNLLIDIVYFIIFLINKVVFFKIISILNPLHPILIEYIITFIIDMKYIDLVNIIIILLCTIFSLIYFEIIILNFCGLNKNIKENIIKREKIETFNELIVDSDIASINEFYNYIFYNN